MIIGGEGRGRPVLLVHGNSMCAASFQPLLDRGFGQAGTAHALELPGHGERCDDPSEASFPAHVQEVQRAVDELGDGTVVVGHSLGGHLAIEVSTHPGVAGVMALAAPPVRTPADFPEAFAPVPLFQAELSEPEVQAAASLLAGGPAERVARWIRQTRPAARGQLAESLGAGELRDEVALVRGASVPVALALCEHDAVVRSSYVHGLGLEAHLWGGAVHEIEGAHHVLDDEGAAKLHDLVGRFLASLPD